MLLLVLILVVIAFGLLVVALLTGSVLWAWVSVGVSVIAAVVLLIDWLQRRSAVKAGAAAPVSAPQARPTPMADLDPATEILPIVPAPGRPGAGSDRPPAERAERVQDAHQTVVMPVVEPSGSSARPSGAEVTATSSGGVSSPSVSETRPESPPSAAAGNGADDVTRTTARAPAASPGDTVSISQETLAEEAVSVDRDRVAASETQPSDATGPDAGKPDAAKPGAGEPAPPEGDGEAAAQQPTGSSPAGDVTEVVKLDRTSEPGDAGSAAATIVVRGPDPVEAAPSGSAQTVVTSLAAVTGSRPDPVADPPRSPADETGRAAADAAAARRQDSTSDVEKTVKVEARVPKSVTDADGASVGASASTPPPAQAPAEQAPPAGSPIPDASTEMSTTERVPVDKAPAAEPVTVDQPPPADQAAQRPPARKDVDLFATAAEPATSTADEPPPGPPGEAPEEQSDPIAAEIVSGLDDEVVVVDEQPRYHVTTCRALVSTAVIPLPVREAVELGFTPCGWCSPERTLAGRHRTAAR